MPAGAGAPETSSDSKTAEIWDFSSLEDTGAPHLGHWAIWFILGSILLDEAMF
jgi:hypothetical protein